MNLKVDVNLCRACLGSELIATMSDKADLMKKFQYSTQLTIESNEPFNLCKRCVTRLKVAYEFRRECLVSASYFEHLRACINKMNAELKQVANTAMSAKLSVTDDELELLLEAGYKSEDIRTVLIQTENETSIQNDLTIVQQIQDEAEKIEIDESHDYASAVEDHFEEAEDEEEYQIEEDTNCIMAASETEDGLTTVGNVKIENETYTCLECNMQFNTKDHLTQHMTKHREVFRAIDDIDDGQKTIESMDDEKHLELPVESSAENYICEICGEAFENQTSLDSHSKTHDADDEDQEVFFEEGASVGTVSESSARSTDSPHHCNVCGKTFSQNYSLIYHMRTHTDERPFSCDQCGARFRQKGSLKQHSYIHTGERPFKCEVCDRGFTQSHSLTFHMRRHTGERPFVCDKCGNSFRQKESLKHHMLVHMENRPVRKRAPIVDSNKCFTCEKCGCVFNKKCILKQHMLTHTGEKPYMCGVCGRGFTQSHSLTFHARRHTGEKPYACEKCGAMFRHDIGLKRHLFSKHSDANKTGKTVLQSKTIERENVSSNDQLDNRSLQSLPETNTTNEKEPTEKPKTSPDQSIEYCEATVKTEKTNDQVSDSENPLAECEPKTEKYLYTCGNCGDGFDTKAKYAEHMQIHDSYKPYRCEICGNGFTQNGSLKQHMLIHTGERPYKCEICGRGFTQGKSLTFHMRRHTGEKPFKCDKCDLTFRLRDILKRHIHVYHASEIENSLICPICLRVLNSQKELTEHVQTHSKPYQCECGKSFVQKSSFRRHQKTHVTDN